MFRAPGSLNRKLDPPVPCNVISLNDNRYVLDDFAPFYAEPQATQPTAFEMDPEKYGSAQRIMDRCVFAQKMLNDPNNVSEPEWKALCDNIALVPDGPKYFHEWSSKRSKYSYDETEKKIQRSQMVKCPETCEYIQKHFSPNCPKEGCGVKAPIVLARLTYKEQIEDLLTKSDLKSDEFLSEKVGGQACQHLTKPVQYAFHPFPGIRIRKADNLFEEEIAMDAITGVHICRRLD